MRPSSRYGVNKRSAAKRFRKSIQYTKALNMHGGVMRGGYRL